MPPPSNSDQYPPDGAGERPFEELPPPSMIVKDAPVRPIKSLNPKFGINMHFGGAFIGHSKHDDAGMGMIGGGFRFRPIPQAAFQADVDFAGGRDYNGLRRAEGAFSLNALIFINPKDRFQVFLLGGFGWSGATVRNDRAVSANGVAYEDERDYAYFGVQGGGGIEWRIARSFAISADIRGLIRGRTDSDRYYHPEFVDDAGRSTNTSAGALITGGGTFYF